MTALQHPTRCPCVKCRLSTPRPSPELATELATLRESLKRAEGERDALDEQYRVQREIAIESKEARIVAEGKRDDSVARVDRAVAKQIALTSRLERAIGMLGTEHEMSITEMGCPGKEGGCEVCVFLDDKGGEKT